jgi:hypothetical protein
MLAQRAQAVRVREAIKGRGLLLHDAFLKFDYDRNGLLSLGEVRSRPSDSEGLATAEWHVVPLRLATSELCHCALPHQSCAAAPCHSRVLCRC